MLKYIFCKLLNCEELLPFSDSYLYNYGTLKCQPSSVIAFLNNKNINNLIIKWIDSCNPYENGIKIWAISFRKSQFVVIRTQITKKLKLGEDWENVNKVCWPFLLFLPAVCCGLWFMTAGAGRWGQGRSPGLGHKLMKVSNLDTPVNSEG